MTNLATPKRRKATNKSIFFRYHSYPLSRIDQLVDLTAGHQLLSFMDAFSGYNHIKMDEANQEKTSFITSQGDALWFEECRDNLSEVG